MYIKQIDKKSKNGVSIYTIHNNSETIGLLYNKSRGFWHIEWKSGKQQSHRGSLWSIRSYLKHLLPRSHRHPNRKVIMREAHRKWAEMKKLYTNPEVKTRVTFAECLKVAWSEREQRRLTAMVRAA